MSALRLLPDSGYTVEDFRRGDAVRTIVFGHCYRVVRVWRRPDRRPLIVCEPLDHEPHPPQTRHLYFDPSHLTPVRGQA